MCDQAREYAGKLKNVSCIKNVAQAYLIVDKKKQNKIHIKILKMGCK
jgi:hypothetical protein